MPSSSNLRPSAPSPELSLESRIRACTRCPDMVRCRQAPVPGVGRRPAALMIVGLAPGRRGADRTGIPFLGDQSGRRLRSALGEAVDRVYITNVVKCAPKSCAAHSQPACLPTRAYAEGRGCVVDGTPCRPRNRDPRDDEIDRCRPYLAEELEEVRPRGVMALGRVAERTAQQLLGRDAGPGAPGQMIGTGPFVVYLPHPAALHYHPDWDRDFEDMVAAVLAAAGVTRSSGRAFYGVERERR